MAASVPSMTSFRSGNCAMRSARSCCNGWFMGISEMRRGVRRSCQRTPPREHWVVELRRLLLEHFIDRGGEPVELLVEILHLDMEDVAVELRPVAERLVRVEPP